MGEYRGHRILDCIVPRRSMDNLERTNSIFQRLLLQLNCDGCALGIEAKRRGAYAIDMGWRPLSMQCVTSGSAPPRVTCPFRLQTTRATRVGPCWKSRSRSRRVWAPHDGFPKFSELVAIMLLGRVRMGFNCRTENKRKLASVRVLPAQGRATFSGSLLGFWFVESQAGRVEGLQSIPARSNNPRPLSAEVFRAGPFLRRRDVGEQPVELDRSEVWAGAWKERLFAQFDTE
jgi:hypothetical protein